MSVARIAAAGMPQNVAKRGKPARTWRSGAP